MSVRMLTGDCRTMLATLPDASVQLCVTSPPYFGLRDYGTASWQGGDAACDHKKVADPVFAVATSTLGGGKKTTGHLQEGFGATCGKCGATRIDQQIGLESTVAGYVAQLVAVFREVRRCLRPDGVLFLNLGDSYANDGKWGGSSGGKHVTALHGNSGIGRQKVDTGLKPKDLIGIPWRVAFALQADGWWLRSEITWCKKAPMPESVVDRPTSATEKIFLLTKSARYFYDAIAVAEESVSDHGSGNGYKRRARLTYDGRGNDEPYEPKPTRNMRNYWLLGPEPFPAAHFAVFPTEIARRAILAGTSEKGACSACGAPWMRTTEAQTESTYAQIKREHNTTYQEMREEAQGNGITPGNIGGTHRPGRRGETLVPIVRATTGWQPTCPCGADLAPCVVLDPFGGAGTVSLVAERLGRDSIYIDLSSEYAAMAEKRVRGDAPLFAAIVSD